MRAVLDGVAAVQLELVVDGVEALLCELITAVLDPPGRTNVFTAHAKEACHISQTLQA